MAEDDERFMRLALVACERGIDAGQSPFGACIVRDGEVMASGHNLVWANTDLTAHAEVVAIRRACSRAGSIDLRGMTIYSTTEPCPMCFSAVHWAGIERIVYGASIADAAGFGFNELAISNEVMVRESGSRVELRGGVLAERSIELFRRWAASGGRAY